MTTVRHVSKCCSLGYSFNFSHSLLSVIVFGTYLWGESVNSSSTRVGSVYGV